MIICGFEINGTSLLISNNLICYVYETCPQAPVCRRARTRLFVTNTVKIDYLLKLTRKHVTNNCQRLFDENITIIGNQGHIAENLCLESQKDALHL